MTLPSSYRVMVERAEVASALSREAPLRRGDRVRLGLLGRDEFFYVSPFRIGTIRSVDHNGVAFLRWDRSAGETLCQTLYLERAY